MEGYLRLHEVAEKLGVAEDTVTKYRQRGLLAGEEVGYQAYLYKVNEVERYLKAKRKRGRPKRHTQIDV